jgi:hypothetical protein
MSLTLSTLTDLAAGFAEDKDQTRYASRYTQAINLAQLQFVKDSGCYWIDASFSVVDATSTYSLPTDFLWEKKATLNGLSLTPVSRETLEIYKGGDRWDDDSGTPTQFLIDPEEANKKLRLYPIPQSGDAGTNNLVLRYVAVPTDLSGASDVPFGSYTYLAPYHLALAYYAAYILLANEPPGPASAKRGQMLRDYQDFVTQASDRFKNTQSEKWEMVGRRAWKA